MNVFILGVAILFALVGLGSLFVGIRLSIIDRDWSNLLMGGLISIVFFILAAFSGLFSIGLA